MKKERLAYLDIIRTIAVISVLVCHYTRALESNGIGYLNKILPDFPFSLYLGSYGVSLFFIISGASLMYVYSEKCEVLTFFKKRFWAIYPMFWLAYIIAFLYNFWVNKGMFYAYPKSRFLLTFFGMDRYLGWYGENYYLLGEWFLGCLIFLYLLFPLLRKGVKDYPKITIVIALAVYVIGSVVLRDTKMPIECWFILRVPEMLFGMYFIHYIKKVNVQAFAVSGVVLIIAAIANLRVIPVIYLTPVIGIASFLVFTFLSKYIAIDLVKKVCGVVSKYSYAVFLCHHFIIEKVAAHFAGVGLSRSGNYFLFTITVAIIILVSRLLLEANNRICKFVKQNILRG